LSGTGGPVPGPPGPPGPFTRERYDNMRQRTKWIVGATVPVAAGSLAAVLTGALPALAQQSGGHHQPVTVTRVGAVHGTPKSKAASVSKPVGKGVIVAQSGKTSADCGVTITPVGSVTTAPSNAIPATAIPATAKPLNIPVTICGPSGTTQAATGVTVTPVTGAPSNAIQATATPVSTVPVDVGQGWTTGAAPS
jgi:hypothetical protein